MTFYRLSMKALAVIFAAGALACVVLLLARPQPIDNAVLGASWQCSRTAFVLTTCAPRLQQAAPAIETSRKDAVKPTRG
jgi:hypothetical protein